MVIFCSSCFFLGIEPASYSILTYFAASKTIDFLLHGLEEYTGVTIISERSEDIRIAIVGELDRGVTIYKGKGGHRKHGENTNDTDIIFTVVTRLEIGRLQNIIKALDPNALIIQHSINDMQGGMIKKRGLH